MTRFTTIAKSSLSAAATLALTGALLPGLAHAATTPASNITVNFSVTVTCTITTTSMDFTTLSSGSIGTNGHDASATITANCDGATTSAPTLGLTSATAVGGVRQLTDTTPGSTRTIPYNIHRDNNRGAADIYPASGATTAIPTSARSTGGTGLPTGNTVITVYGRIPASTNILPGVYRDTVSAVLTY